MQPVQGEVEIEEDELPAATAPVPQQQLQGEEVTHSNSCITEQSRSSEPEYEEDPEIQQPAAHFQPKEDRDTSSYTESTSSDGVAENTKQAVAVPTQQPSQAVTQCSLSVHQQRLGQSTASAGHRVAHIPDCHYWEQQLSGLPTREERAQQLTQVIQTLHYRPR